MKQRWNKKTICAQCKREYMERLLFSAEFEKKGEQRPWPWHRSSAFKNTYTSEYLPQWFIFVPYCLLKDEMGFSSSLNTPLEGWRRYLCSKFRMHQKIQHIFITCSIDTLAVNTIKKRFASFKAWKKLRLTWTCLSDNVWGSIWFI